MTNSVTPVTPLNSANPTSPITPVGRTTDSLADILERVLDKGIVVAGDIMVNVVDIELLTLKVRLLVASVETARDLGIDWWTSDPFLSNAGQRLQRDNDELRQRVGRLEEALSGAAAPGRAIGSEPEPAAPVDTPHRAGQPAGGTRRDER
ncbi:MAG TPA: gas vesicle protein GvpJ [Mycobacteriales bacterium]|nr:gas vesicle protein GvpJ [Mycobacteriales bacterium]